ncbi:MAG: glycosyltransferase family 4 protein [bacterium]|nr:glycosyltransferase family 4 protein [bacterium]
MKGAGLPAVHQVVAGFADGDAISDLALALQAVFRRWGHESEIFCPRRHIDPKMRGRALDLHEHRARSAPRNILYFHFSIGSETVEYFRRAPDRKVLVYHNITPGRWFRSIYDEREAQLVHGREDLATLAGVAGLVLADSAFNAGELAEAGFRDVKVMPLILDPGRLAKPPDAGILRGFRDGVPNILFVGRVVPNKRFEDLIRAFYAYRRFTGKPARLLLVGSATGLERYLAFLRHLVRELSLDDVVFARHVRLDALTAFYRAADLFLCMSEHEGFCIPLLEAMHFGVPILAYRAAAVAETLGGGGVLFDEKDFPAVAEMMDLLLRDGPLRAAVVARQRARLADFEPARLEERLKGYLAPWLTP